MAKQEEKALVTCTCNLLNDRKEMLEWIAYMIMKLYGSIAVCSECWGTILIVIKTSKLVFISAGEQFNFVIATRLITCISAINHDYIVICEIQ